LIEGDFIQAQQHFSQAHNQAEAYQDVFTATEALLGQAQARLACRELEAAQNTFLAVGRQFQLLESANGDGAAVLGVAQVNLGLQQWDEAQANCDAAITRFSQSSDLINQADAYLTRGLVHRSKDEMDEALADFEQALKYYHQQHRPLGMADTHFARASILLVRNDLEKAREEQSQAIALVEQVMNTINKLERWTTFLRQYAEQYAATVITDLRHKQDESARLLLERFIRIAGASEIEYHLKAYENTIPTESEDVSEEELNANRDLLKRLEKIRKGLP
jgi:tetratricopeptide (TPR) repeat protein